MFALNGGTSRVDLAMSSILVFFLTVVFLMFDGDSTVGDIVREHDWEHHRNVRGREGAPSLSLGLAESRRVPRY